jgi:serine phosphatase RsbU (regulator of sigma subunit)
MTSTNTVSLIQQVPLFAGLPLAEIQRLAQALQSVSVPAGAILFLEGDPGNNSFILIKGEVEIIKELGTPDERLMGIRSVGSLIGEMSLFSPGHRRTSTVRARSPLQLLEITQNEFEALLKRQPLLAYRIIHLVSNRLAEAENVTIRDLRFKNQELTRAYQELKAAQEQLIEKEKIEQELQVARRIQLSMMPPELPQHPGYDFTAHIQPMRAVGGDFYDFIPLGPDHLGVAIGDVTDHGVPAALFMAMTVTLLRAEVAPGVSPVQTIKRLNQQLLKSNSLNMFVTLLYGILDFQNGEFQYVRAGHELPLVQDSSGVVRQLAPAPGAILGFMEDAPLEQSVYILQPGERLFLYTDGLTDEFDPQDSPFGLSRLLEALQALCQAELGAVGPALFDRLREHRGSSPQFDDITILAIQAKGLSRTP